MSGSAAAPTHFGQKVYEPTRLEYSIDSDLHHTSMYTDVRETHKLVIKHIHKARTIPGLEDATIVLVLESNLA